MDPDIIEHFFHSQHQNLGKEAVWTLSKKKTIAWIFHQNNSSLYDLHNFWSYAGEKAGESSLDMVDLHQHIEKNCI